MKRAKILIAENQTLVAEGLRAMLEPEYDVVKIVGDGQRLVISAKELDPDVVLLDLNMPILNGLDAGIELKRSLPRTKIIVITANEDAGIASQALRLCATGYLLKNSAGTELKKAVSAVLSGRVYVTPRIAQGLITEVVNGSPMIQRKLTPRQRQVLQLLAEGHGMKQAAHTLNIATRTIAFHKYRIMDQFDLKSNADLLRFALREQIMFVDQV